MDMGDSQNMEEEEEEKERTAPAATPKRRRGPGQTIVIETSSKKQKGGQQQQQQQQRGATDKSAMRRGVAAPSKAKRARPKRVSHTAPEVTESFGRYIHKVQQQVHPGLRMSKKTVSILDSMVVDVYSRLLAESRRLLTSSKMKTLTSRDVQTAVRLCLPGELSKHAVSEGQKAVTMSA
jgi:histone H2B